MPGTVQEFESTRTVVMDAFDVLKPRAPTTVQWPMDDDTAGPACLPCLPHFQAGEETLAVEARIHVPSEAYAPTSALDNAHELDENDLVPLTWIERLDTHLDALPHLVSWAILYAMLGASALCAALIAFLLCLPAPN